MLKQRAWINSLLEDTEKNPMLCHCTLGHERAMWSIVFGKQINVEIIESFQRGGNDCVTKIFI